jgi:hypothetical protein
MFFTPNYVFFGKSPKNARNTRIRGQGVIGINFGHRIRIQHDFLPPSMCLLRPIKDAKKLPENARIRVFSGIWSRIV